MVVVLAVLVASCAPAAPEVIEKEVVVEKEVPVTVEIEKEVVVEKKVVETVEVEKVVEKEVIVEVPKESARSGGYLDVVFETGLEDTFDVASQDSTHSAFLTGNMYDTPINKNIEDGQFYPHLAESWEVSDDNLSITLHLRKDVVFHDGTPFNAEAVKWNYDRVMEIGESTGGAAVIAFGADKLDKIEVLDEYTVKISYNELHAQMISLLSAYGTSSVMSPTAVEKYGEQYGTEYAVGTGPFKFDQFTGMYALTSFTRNDDYNWAPAYMDHQGAPYLEGFAFHGIAEGSSRTAAVWSRDADIGNVQAASLPDFDADPDFKTQKVRRARFMANWLNTDNPIFQDERMRQAIAHTIDTETILNSPTFSGVGEICYSPLTSGLWGDTSEFKEYNYLYDLDKANALLEEVGWTDEDGDGFREAHGVEGVEDGTRLEFRYQLDAEAVERMELFAGIIMKAGFYIDMQVYDHNTVLALREAGEWDIATVGQGAASGFVINHNVRCDGSWNDAGYCNPEVDALLDIADGTVDPKEQREAWRQAQQLIIQDAWWQPVVTNWWSWAMRKEVMGLKVDSTSYGLYVYDMWFDE
jgi:peptide/nickel transport system substrate-binding protein